MIYTFTIWGGIYGFPHSLKITAVENDPEKARPEVVPTVTLEGSAAILCHNSLLAARTHKQKQAILEGCFDDMQAYGTIPLEDCVSELGTMIEAAEARHCK